MEGKFVKSNGVELGICVFVCERTENFRSFRNLPP